AQPDAMILRNFCVLFPIGDEPLLPLPAIEVHVPRREGIQDPVGHLVAGYCFGQTGQKGQPGNSDLAGEGASWAKVMIVGTGVLRVRMQWFTVQSEGADR